MGGARQGAEWRARTCAPRRSHDPPCDWRWRCRCRRCRRAVGYVMDGCCCALHVWLLAENIAFTKAGRRRRETQVRRRGAWRCRRFVLCGGPRAPVTRRGCCADATVCVCPLQTAREFMVELVEAGCVDRSAAQAFLAVYERATFSSEPVSEGDLFRLQEAIRHMFLT
jgi:hypothetical protein